MQHRGSRFVLLLLCASAVLGLGAGAAAAATCTWTGGGGYDDLWTTAANWGGTAPSAGDDLVFPAGAGRFATINDFVGGTWFPSITIGSSSYTFGGNQIQPDRITTTYPGGSVELPLGILLTGDTARRVTVGEGGTLDLSGVISGSSHTCFLTKDGPGILQIDGDNTFQGLFHILAGEVRVTSDNALGDGSTTLDWTIVLPGAKLTLADGLTVGEPLGSDTGAGAGPAAIEALGSARLNGPVTMVGDLQLSAPAGETLTLAGVVSDSTAGSDATITKAGDGRLELTNAANGFAAGTTLSAEAGTIAIGSAAPLGPAALKATGGGTLLVAGGTSISNPISLSGAGYDDKGALQGGSGADVCTGTITLAGDATIGASGTSLTVSDIAAGASKLTVAGTAPVVVSGMPAFAGNVDVTGTLRVDGTLLADTATVKSGGLLDGTGTVNRVAVESGGTLEPGHGGPGRLHITASISGLTMAGGATLSVHIDGPTAGTEYGQIVLDGGGNILGGPTLAVSLGGSYAHAPGTRFVIIDKRAHPLPVGGTFAGLPEGAAFPVDGRWFRITYRGYTGTSVVLTAIDAPVVGFTSPVATSVWPAGSTQSVAWTVTPAPPGGEFRVWLVSVAGGWYVGKSAAAVKDQASYATSVRAAVPAGAGYRAAVYWRPTAGSGAWQLTAKSAAFTVVDPTAIAITAPTAASSWTAGSVQPVSWEVTPALPGGEFRVWLVSADGGWYVAKSVPGVKDQTDYETNVRVAVPAGNGYRAAVYWRPVAGGGDWQLKAKSAVFAVVDPASLAVTSPTAASSWRAGSGQTVTWTVTPAASGGEFRLWLVSASGSWYYLKDVTATDDETDYDATVRAAVPAAAGYRLAVYWRPAAGSGDWQLKAKSAAFEVTP